MKKRKNDLTAKILTLVIAVFLWSYVMSDTNPQITKEIRNISVTYLNTAALDRQGLVIMEPEDVKINVRLSGNKMDLDNIDGSNIFAQVDLSGYSEGQVRVPITVGLLDQSSAIRVESSDPKEVLFTFDRIITKDMEPIVDLTGQLGEDYILGDIVTRPQKILLRGPRSWVNQVTKISALVDISGKTDTMNLAVPIKILNDSGEEVRGIEKDPGLIDMTIPIFRAIDLPIELITINELPENYSVTDIEISPSTVRVKGDNSIVNLNKLDTVEVDINQLLETTAMEVELNLPEGVTLVDPAQKITISYKVEEIITTEFEFGFDDIAFENLGEGLSLGEDALNQVFSVEITGFKSIIESINLQNLEIKADLMGLTAGTHKIEVSFALIDNISYTNEEPITVEVNLNEN